MYPQELSGISVGGVYIHEPGSLLTNFLIFGLSLVLVVRMKGMSGSWVAYWRLFIGSIGLTSAGGLFTHGFPLLFTESTFYILWATKNSFVLVGNLFASLALIGLYLPKGQFKLQMAYTFLLALKAIIVLLAMCSSLTFTPVVFDLGVTYVLALSFTFLKMNDLLGMRQLFFAFVIAFFSGFLYVFPWYIHPQWLTNSDVVHLFMLCSMALIYMGALKAWPEVRTI